SSAGPRGGSSRRACFRSRRATPRGIGHRRNHVRADLAASPHAIPPHLRGPPDRPKGTGTRAWGACRGAVSSRIVSILEEVMMEVLKKHDVWSSKPRAIVIAAFTLAIGTAGRVMADPTSQSPGS